MWLLYAERLISAANLRARMYHGGRSVPDLYIEIILLRIMGIVDLLIPLTLSFVGLYVTPK